MSTLDWFVSQAQNSAPNGPSPEVLAALSELVKALSGHPTVTNPRPFDPHSIEVVTSFISSLAWPALGLYAILTFRPQLVRLLEGVTDIKAFGIEAKIKQELRDAAADADKSGNKSSFPSAEELARAVIVDDLTTQADIDFIRKQVDELAAKYEMVRASQEPGDARTRAMEVIVSQMRTIGRAASRFRYELKESPSPGKRLQAIASLQVLPDYDLLDWLARSIKTEKPFVAYHAIVAMNVAAHGPHARKNLEYLKDSLELVRVATASLKETTDRKQQVQKLEEQIRRLSQ